MNKASATKQKGNIHLRNICLLLMILTSFTPIWGGEEENSLLTGENCAALEGAIIDSVHISGLEHTKLQVILRELRHQVNQPFSCAKWQIEKDALQGLDVFSRVELQIQTAGDERISLNYEFEEMFQWMIFPAGKTTDQDGLLLGLSILNLNTAGQDIRLEAQFRTSVSPVFRAKEWMLQASSPWMGSWPLEWSAVTVHADSWNPLKEFQEDSWWSQFRQAYPLSRRWKITATQEHNLVKHDVAAEGWKSSTWYDQIFIGGAGVRFDNRNRLTNPQKGVWVDISTALAGGDDSFFRHTLDFRSWYSLNETHRFHGAALTRLRPGLDAFYLRYFPGGANSLRGHHADPGRSAINETLFTAEYRMEFFDRKTFQLGSIKGIWGLQWVTGADAAVYGDTFAMQTQDKLWGLFTGLHLLVPGIERIRLEYGWSPEKPSGVFSLALFSKSITHSWNSR